MGNNERYFHLRIRPTNTSGIGDPKCELTVTEQVRVITEPIEAMHANDFAALGRAVDDVARRLGVSVENIQCF